MREFKMKFTALIRNPNMTTGNVFFARFLIFAAFTFLGNPTLGSPILGKSALALRHFS
jgi:hypothetical protein